MTSDPNKKTTRTFQCREALWEKFEQMARELECSIDYLINDSMKQYLRQRGYGSTAASIAPGTGAGGPPPPPGRQVSRAPPPPPVAPAPAARAPAGPPPMAAARAASSQLYIYYMGE